MKWKAFIFVLIFGAIGSCLAQVQFEAKVSKEKLGINERLRIDFEMNQDGDNFNPPDFDGFRVVGGPNQAVSNSWINGKRSYSKTYSFFLAPQKRGRITIGQATIEIEGEIYKTSPIRVEVTAAVEKPKDGNNADFVASENVHLVAEVSKTDPYLNEAITVVYKMYVSNEVSITSSWRELDTPKYADFWSQNIDSRGNYKIFEGKYKGQDYRYVVLRTTVLYPQKSGELQIEPLTLDVPIDVLSNRRDIFGRRLTTRVNKTISAGKRTINVKPLPTDGRPADFSGAVGQFDFSVTADRTALDANESLQLAITVKGKGNLKLFDLPSVTVPSSLEMYEPEREENVTTKLSGMEGSVTDRYTVVPQFKGDFPIRPISFSYFDTDTRAYKTLTSDEIVINVANGPITEATNTSRDETAGKRVVETTDQFKYIMLDPALRSVDEKTFFRSSKFWYLLAAPFVFIPLLIVMDRNRRRRLLDVDRSRVRQADKLARKFLQEAKRNQNNKEAFYEALERALHNFLKAQLDLSTSEMSKEHIANLLRDNGVEEITIEDFTQLLKSCEFARYTPANSDTIRQDYEKAAQTMLQINKQMGR
ncbi:BatD family protein [Aureitalea marina]|uniref:BatD protein n=1 Tax=Aureitalea marina TaxID=930804 RepID=A0A2S7KRS7_9FLAO|nr:BatD family protein [Aureitalea marina]PQB05331.1 BatD protein [Aureitalea marina]